MGEAKQSDSATARLIRQFPHCSLCGGLRPSTTRDHIPAKALFDNSHRPNKLVMPACDECNQGTSTSDLVVSIISRLNLEYNKPEMDDYSRLVSRLRKQCPEIIAEWTGRGFIEKKKAKQRLEKHGVRLPLGADVISIGRQTTRLLNLFSYKIALGLYFEHFQEPLPNSGLVSGIWRTKEDFAKYGVPTEIIEMMPGYATLQQGKWDTKKEFEYRFSVNRDDGIFGCLARFRTSLFVTGFAIKNGELLPDAERGGWIRPMELLSILKNPEFEKRLQ
jgi:hypothetical protein